MITEASFKIVKNADKVQSVAVSMPIWSKPSDKGCHLNIDIPFLGLTTVAKDEMDSRKAIEEAIESFCIVAERFGQGIEKELESIGWSLVDENTREPIFSYDIEDANSVIDHVIKTGDRYTSNLTVTT